jgi:ribosomal protein S6
MRTYELVVVYDPRVGDDEVISLTGDAKKILTAPGGVTITKTDVWGRRRLAYPIHKLTEGKFAVVYFAVDNGRAPIPELERRLLQNDKVLRFLTTRTDEGLKRAGLPIPTEPEPEKTEEPAKAAGEEKPVEKAEKPVAEKAAAKAAEPEEAPAGEAPAEEAPAGEAPAEEAPAEDAGEAGGEKEEN